MLGGSLWAAKGPAPAAPEQASESASKPATPAPPTAPDHAKSYYHFMLARRYKELAGVYNRPDYIDRAVSEYKQAIAADPDSSSCALNWPSFIRAPATSMKAFTKPRLC